MIKICFLLSHVLLSVVHAACLIEITGVDFGNYDVFETGNLDGAGNIDISCQPRATVMITFSTGNSNNYANRQLNYLNHQLNYNLYANAGMNKILGDGTNNTVVLDGNNVKNKSFTIYGRILARQNVRVGSYSDHIMVNLYF